MRVLSCFLLTAMVGCASSAPEITRSEPPAIREVAFEPQPIPVASRPMIAEIEGRSVPETPKRVIARRSAYPAAGLVEWTLTNGLLVVYRHAPALDEYTAVLSPLAAADLEAERSVIANTRLSSVLEDVERRFAPSSRGADGGSRALGAPSGYAFVLTGPTPWEWIERDLAIRLSRVVGLEDVPAPRAPSRSWRAPVDWDEWPAYLLASQVVLERLPSATFAYDATSERAYLALSEDVDSIQVERALARATEAEMRSAREMAVRYWSSPSGVVAALATLYRVSGTFRPARAPENALDVAARIARMPPGRVDDILRRFRPEPDE